MPVSIAVELEEEAEDVAGCKKEMSVEKAECGFGTPLKVDFILGTLSVRFIVIE